MPFARWRNRLILLAATLFAGLLVLVSSQHRARLIFGSFVSIDSEAAFDADSVRFDRMRFMMEGSISHPSEKGLPQAVSILTAFNQAHPPAPGDDLPAIDDADSCRHYLEMGRKLHCYNVDIGASEILAEQGILSRMWDINGPKELGGFGHNMLEVFDGPTHSWRALDPYYHCYFTLGSDTSAISFAALRIALLTSNPEIHINRYYHTDLERPDSNILFELRYLAPCAMLHANNDFRWRYNHRYGFLTFTSGLIDQLPLRAARGVRTIMMGSSDTRFIIEDRFSPHYPIQQLRALFYSLCILLVLTMIGLTVVIRYHRTQGHQGIR